jgi:hypothetical protein
LIYNDHKYIIIRYTEVVNGTKINSYLVYNFTTKKTYLCGKSKNVTLCIPINVNVEELAKKIIYGTVKRSPVKIYKKGNETCKIYVLPTIKLLGYTIKNGTVTVCKENNINTEILINTTEAYEYIRLVNISWSKK